MALVEDENYVFFPKGSYMEVGNIEGAFDGRCCLICTKEYIFVIPDAWNEFGTQTMRHMTFGAYQEGEKTSENLATMIANCESIEILENNCKELLQGKEQKRVLKIADLEGFKVKGGILGQARFKRTDGKKCTLVAMGSGNKKRFKNFYS